MTLSPRHAAVACLLLMAAGCATPKPSDRTALAIEQAEGTAKTMTTTIDDVLKHNAKAITAIEKLRDQQARGAK